MTEEKVDANDFAAEHGPEALAEAMNGLTKEADELALYTMGFRNIDQLVAEYGGDYRQHVIHGLLRRGETMNVVADSKAGKSWLLQYILLCIAAGKPLFGREEWHCEPGMVVLIDNELHPETLSARLPAVVKAMGADPSIRKKLLVRSLRGEQKPLEELAPMVRHLKVLEPSLVVLDSL
ncbi:MAG: AAA family ATPase, partial [Alphaproteobacteria bacterium]